MLKNERTNIQHTWLATCRSTSPIGNVSADSFKCCLTALSRFSVVSSLLSTPSPTPSVRRTSDNLRSRRAWHDRNANCCFYFHFFFYAEAKTAAGAHINQKWCGRLKGKQKYRIIFFLFSSLSRCRRLQRYRRDVLLSFQYKYITKTVNRLRRCRCRPNMGSENTDKTSKYK